MPTATIYATAIQEENSKTAYLGISIHQKKPKKITNKVTHIDSKSALETQIGTLIHSLAMLPRRYEFESVTVISDILVLHKFIDVGVEVSSTFSDNCLAEKPIDAHNLWGTLMMFVQKYKVIFALPTDTDEIFRQLKIEVKGQIENVGDCSFGETTFSCLKK